MLEVALSLVLLVGASLFVRSFMKLQGASGGFDPAHILTLRVHLPGDVYEEEMPKTRKVEELARVLAAVPGVEAVGASNNIPLGGGGGGASVLIEGRPVAARGRSRGSSTPASPPTGSGRWTSGPPPAAA